MFEEGRSKRCAAGNQCIAIMQARSFGRQPGARRPSEHRPPSAQSSLEGHVSTHGIAMHDAEVPAWPSGECGGAARKRS